MRISLHAVSVLSLLICLASAQPPDRITPAQAKDYLGKTATVCGKVASAKYAINTRRKPTFLNLDEPFPKHIFTAVIWDDARSKFGQPDVELLNKRICVTGSIEEYKSKPEMILRSASQLKVEQEFARHFPSWKPDREKRLSIRMKKRRRPAKAIEKRDHGKNVSQASRTKKHLSAVRR